jgi:hypothetical protein
MNPTDYDEILDLFRQIAVLPSTRFQPGYIGGHCVMPNLALLEEMRPSPFIEAIRHSNAEGHLRSSDSSSGRMTQPSDPAPPSPLTSMRSSSALSDQRGAA